MKRYTLIPLAAAILILGLASAALATTGTTGGTASNQSLPPSAITLPEGLSAADWAEITGQVEALQAAGLPVVDNPSLFALPLSGLFYQQAYLKASNTGGLVAGDEAVGDLFGYSVAISGDTVVVGAPGEDSNATGVNGNQSNNSLESAGAAYVFVRVGSTWIQQAYLKASNTGAYDNFGNSVAISGNTVVVGAFYEDSNATGVNGNQSNNSAADAGAAYVFVRNGTTWSQQAYLKASNTDVIDYFGASVAISGDSIVVGAYGEDSKATGVNGNQLDNSVDWSGAAYVFVRVGSTWSQQAYLKASNTGASDLFGTSVAISGNTAAVGAVCEDSAATGVNGNQSDNSAKDAGAAFIFTRSGTTWSQQAYLKASNTGAGDDFGFAVAVWGDTAVVGAPREDSSATGIDGNQAKNNAEDSGAAYTFKRSGTSWTQQAYLKASDTAAEDGFGWSVALADDRAVVGAVFKSVGGAAYVFARSGNLWTQRTRLKASNPGAGDWFGDSVSLCDGTIVVGARQEDSSATGVNGNQFDNSATDAGAAYVFATTATGGGQLPYRAIANGSGSYVATASPATMASFLLASETGPSLLEPGVSVTKGVLRWNYGDLYRLVSTDLTWVAPAAVPGYVRAVQVGGTGQLQRLGQVNGVFVQPVTVEFVATVCDGDVPLLGATTTARPDAFGIDILGVSVPGETGPIPLWSGEITVR